MTDSLFFLCRPLLVLLALAGVLREPLSGQAVPAVSSSATVAPNHAPNEVGAKPPAKDLREAQIAADSEKLYQLAQQLKVEMDKSSKDMLSLSVVKKAAEIEKLARSLSDRMKSN